MLTCFEPNRSAGQTNRLPASPPAVEREETKQSGPIDSRLTSFDTPKRPALTLSPHPQSLTLKASLSPALANQSPSGSNGLGSHSSSTSLAGSTTMSIFSSKPNPPHTLSPLNVSSYRDDNQSTINNAPKSPRSPGGSRLGAFFGWGGSSPASPTTSLSEASPATSPVKQRKPSQPTQPKGVPLAIDVSKANVGGDLSGKERLGLATSARLEDMEQELREISSELAGSIRREMELEDLVDRLQADAQPTTGSAGKRTSDYFSDSGTSSVRYGDSDARVEELDRLQRRTELDKAKMRLELTQKVQDERMRRKQLESQIRILEDKAAHVSIKRREPNVLVANDLAGRPGEHQLSGG